MPLYPVAELVVLNTGSTVVRKPISRKKHTLGDRTTEISFTLPQPLDTTPCLLFLSGINAGVVLPLDVETGPVVLGRGDDCTVRIESPEVSRVHAIITNTPDGVLQIEDQGSSNGTFLNGSPVRRALLGEGDKLQLGPHLLLKLLFHDDEELELAAQFFERANQDSLTGLANRRYLVQHLEREVAFARRHRRPLTLALVDIDRFKAVNDTYGHGVGDDVLRQLAARGLAAVRTEDLFGRYGGEEFAVVLRDTGAGGAVVAAERLRRVVCDDAFDFGTELRRVTVSIGVVSVEGDGWPGVSLEHLIETADARLYVAKRAGRNRVEARTPALQPTLESEARDSERTRSNPIAQDGLPEGGPTRSD